MLNDENEEANTGTRVPAHRQPHTNPLIQAHAKDPHPNPLPAGEGEECFIPAKAGIQPVTFNPTKNPSG